MSSDEDIESESGSGSEMDEDEDESGSSEEEVRVKVRSAKETLQKPLEEIEKVNEVFQISGVVARQLLRHFKWNSEKVVSRYFEGQKDKLFKEAKIPTNLSEWKKPNKSMECTICTDDISPENLTGLPCNHFFCNDCYTDYLIFLITKSAQSGGIACPKKGCNLQIDEITVLKLLPKDSKARDLFYILAAKEYVKDRTELKSCPSGSCDKILEYHRELHPEDIPIVECSCGDRMCWDCGLTDHSPATCKMLQDWNKKTEGDSQTQNWLKLYTKQCPNPKGCNAIITKDGGCQYMRCATCHHGFCWICLGAFDHKNHNCNALKIDPNSDQIAQDLAKYEHFSKRYAIHAQSITFQSKLKTKCEELMNRLNKEQGMNYNEIQFVEQARQTTILARRMLKDTYIFGYYLPKGVNPQLFEFIQGELESNTEKLTSFLEGDPKVASQKHLQIKDLSTAIRKNIDSVVEDLYKGSFKGGKEITKVWEPTVKIGYDGWIYNAGN